MKYAVVFTALAATAAAQQVTYPSDYTNPFTSFLTQTDSNGVVTGMPTAVVTQPAAETSQPAAETSPADDNMNTSIAGPAGTVMVVDGTQVTGGAGGNPTGTGDMTMETGATGTGGGIVIDSSSTDGASGSEPTGDNASGSDDAGSDDAASETTGGSAESSSADGAAPLATPMVGLGAAAGLFALFL